jgi:hypothetical protein
MVNILLKKKSLAVTILSALLIAFFAQLNVARAAVGSEVDTEEVLLFLRDVVQLDMTKYETSLTEVGTEYPPWLDGVAQTNGQYSLDATGLNIPTLLMVTFTFFDKQLIALSLYEESQGPTLFTAKPPADLRDAALGFLQRYQTHTGDPQLSQMRSILETVEPSSNITKTVDDLSLEVNVKNNRTVFTWSNTANGAAYSQLKLRFQDGVFTSFYDDRSSYKLGSSEVNISEEEAVNIALERVKSFSYQYADKEITDFNIVTEKINSRTGFQNRTDRMVMYPCYIVDLPLDAIYPGSVAYIEVWIWADSGEVVSCEALGYGFPSGPSDQTSSSGTPQTENDDAPPPTMYIAALAAAIAVFAFASIVIIKKRRSK